MYICKYTFIINTCKLFLKSKFKFQNNFPLIYILVCCKQIVLKSINNSDIDILHTLSLLALSLSACDICFWFYLHFCFDFVWFVETSTCASPLNFQRRQHKKLLGKSFLAVAGGRERLGVGGRQVCLCGCAFVFCIFCVFVLVAFCRLLTCAGNFSVRRQMKQQDDNLRSRTTTGTTPLPLPLWGWGATASELCALAFMNV